MSFDNERKRRMEKILELLRVNPQGLTLQTIAKESKCLTEITKERLYLYMEELEWAGIVSKRKDGIIRLR